MEVEFDPLQNKRDQIVGEIYSGPEVYELKACFKGYSTNMHLGIKHNGDMVYSEVFSQREVDLDSDTDKNLSELFDYALDNINEWDFDSEIVYIGERELSKLNY